ncbi:MAG: hypothetical protein K0V04_34030 [Deltaproteobacteria bacterium]|nr:hypothetical protein [Deltaproteobacteria bacterium]
MVSPPTPHTVESSLAIAVVERLAVSRPALHGLALSSCIVSGIIGCQVDAGNGGRTAAYRMSDADQTIHAKDCGGRGGRVEGGSGSDRLYGGSGPDELIGAGKGDLLDGGPGEDLLDGGPGPDLLNGGPDNDALNGGAGSDYYVVQAYHGHDVIDDPEGSHDRLTLADIHPDEVLRTTDGNDLVLTFPGGSVRIVDYEGRGAIELIDYEWGQTPFESPDYGIYWFGKGDERTKYIPTVDNPNFDPSKPIILLAHGWQAGAISRREEHGLNFKGSQGPDIDLADAWIDAGWNVGLFNWQNFADEDGVKDAEGKIWSAQGNDGDGMRWRSADGSLNDWPFDFSVGQLAHGSLVAGLLEANAPTVRLAGHSLGNQVATAIASGLLANVQQEEVSSRMLPERVSLLDPFWSGGGKGYLDGQTTGARVHQLVGGLLDAGVAVDAYRSSALSSPPLGDTNKGLMDDVCLVELRPRYFRPGQQALKHIAGFWHYLLGFQFPTTLGGEEVPTAVAPVSVLEACIDGDDRWRQDEGTETKTPQDDTYQR